MTIGKVVDGKPRPQGIDMETLRDFADWHVQNGRGRHIAALDRRGLDYLLEKHMPTAGFRIPPEDEQIGGGRIYLGLAF